MEAKEIRVIVDRWVIANEQYEKANKKLEELAKEILNYVKTNYEELLAVFAHGYKIYLSDTHVDNNKLWITYTDNWLDCPEYANLIIPIDELWRYEKYFEDLYNEYLERENAKLKEEERIKEEKEYQRFLELKKKYDKDN